MDSDSFIQSFRDAIREPGSLMTEAQREYLGLLVRREARRLRRTWILPAVDVEAMAPGLRPQGGWLARLVARRRLLRRALVTLEVLGAADFDRAEACRAIRILRETGAMGLLTLTGLR